MTLAVIDALNRAWGDIQRRNVALPGVTIWVMSGHGGTQCGSIRWDGPRERAIVTGMTQTNTNGLVLIVVR